MNTAEMKIYPHDATRTHSYRHKSAAIAVRRYRLYLLTLLLALGSYTTSSSLSAESLAAADSVFRFQSKMAQRGHVASQYALAYMYESGQGTEKDLGLATDWYQKATQQGFVPARDRLVYIDILKSGFQPEKQQWLLKLKQTADDYNHKHQGESAFLLGQLYAAGLAVNKSLTMALKYLHLAEAANVIGSDSEIRRVEAELDALRASYADNEAETAPSTQQSDKTTATTKPVQSTSKAAEVSTQKPPSQPAPRPVAQPVTRPVTQNKPAAKPAVKPTATAIPAGTKHTQTASVPARPQPVPAENQDSKAEPQEPHPMQVICSGWQRLNSACR